MESLRLRAEPVNEIQSPPRVVTASMLALDARPDPYGCLFSPNSLFGIEPSYL
jgi:hypothetical protein